MTTIDYSKYSIDDLLDAKATIDKNSYPENYEALMNEFSIRNFSAEEYNKEQESNKIEFAAKRVKIVGMFQMSAAIIIPLYMLFLIANGHRFNAVVYSLAAFFVLINAASGWSA